MKGAGEEHWWHCPLTYCKSYTDLLPWINNRIQRFPSPQLRKNLLVEVMRTRTVQWDISDVLSSLVNLNTLWKCPCSADVAHPSLEMNNLEWIILNTLECGKARVRSAAFCLKDMQLSSWGSTFGLLSRGTFKIKSNWRLVQFNK